MHFTLHQSNFISQGANNRIKVVGLGHDFVGHCLHSLVGVDHGIEASDATPSKLLVFLGPWCMSEAYFDIVVLSKELLDSLHNGGLRFLLGEVVDNWCCANVELG